VSFDEIKAVVEAGHHGQRRIGPAPLASVKT
jgi:hypothetical protein